jgi:hypothetical protein
MTAMQVIMMMPIIRISEATRNSVRFQVLTAASKKTVFWLVAPCSLVEVYRRFRGACYVHHHGGNQYPDHSDDGVSNHI